MSEKRFKLVKPLGFTNLLKKDVFIKDRENDYYIRFVEEVVDLLNELNDENEQLRKERDYWEQSSKHRQRLLENSEKELRLHNAYLIDNNQAEDYQRWRRSNK